MQTKLNFLAPPSLTNSLGDKAKRKRARTSSEETILLEEAFETIARLRLLTDTT